jgi:DNA-binding MarR family transcriptional regulator
MEAGSASVLAFTRLLRAHASVTRQLSAELLADHGLTINAYEALLRISHEEGQRIKRIDLSRQILLTPSGITRLLDGLESAGLVESVSCPTDRRVSYAQLTDAGRERLAAASESHLASIRGLFEQHLSAAEIDALGAALGKLPEVAGDDAAC